MSNKFTVQLNNTPFFQYGAPPKMTTEERLKRDLEIALQRIEAMTEMPGVFASVLEVGEKYSTVCTGPQTIAVRTPKAMEGLEPGAIVRLRPPGVETDGFGRQQQVPPTIMEVVANPPTTGAVVTVRQVLDDRYAECQVQGNKVVVMYRGKPPRPDDAVILDFTEKCIIRNLGRVDKSRVFADDTGVSWDDIGGLEEAKKEMREAIEGPIVHKEIYERYGMKPTRGVLLFGPPGTGKTMLGKAAATALAKVYGATAKSGGFLYVKGPEMLNMFVGNSEANIRSLFAMAREHKRQHGYPAIVFIDEADALMGKRGAGRGIEGMERTLVPQFLAEMDGLEEAGCMVILATNRPDTLDPAVVREGRVDTKIYVRRPTKDESKNIFALYVKNVPIAKKENRDNIIEKATERLFDDKHGALLMLECKDSKTERFGMCDLVSGARIAGITKKAVALAMRREREGGKPEGLTVEDFYEAIKTVTIENRALDHVEAVRDFIETKKLDVVNIRKVNA